MGCRLPQRFGDLAAVASRRLHGRPACRDRVGDKAPPRRENRSARWRQRQCPQHRTRHDQRAEQRIGARRQGQCDRGNRQSRANRGSIAAGPVPCHDANPQAGEALALDRGGQGEQHRCVRSRNRNRRGGRPRRNRRSLVKRSGRRSGQPPEARQTPDVWPCQPRSAQSPANSRMTMITARKVSQSPLWTRRSLLIPTIVKPDSRGRFPRGG